MPNKKYKSLKDVYVSESFLKPVPKLPRQCVNEAKVRITFDDGRVKELETSDYTASKLIGVEAKVSGNINQSVSQWLASGGWKSESVNIAAPILMGIIERNLKTNNTGVVKEILEDINNILKLKKSLNNFRDNLKSNQFLGFIKNFPILLKQLGNINLVRDIQRNCIFLEGNVAVGPGEVLATLYSEMKNPPTGDLIFPDGKKVELKGSTKESTGGRPGKKNVIDAANKATTALAADYSKKRGELDATTIYKLKEIAKNVQGKIQSLNVKTITANMQRFINIINIIVSNPNFKIDDIYKNITKDIEALGKAGDKLTGTNYGSQVAELLGSYEKNKEGKEVTTFRSYFNTEKDPNVLTDKLLMFSVRPNQIDRNILLAYVSNLGIKFNSEYAARIVSAMQIADYFVDEGYSFIIFFTSLGQDDRQVVIGEFTNDYMANLKLCLDNALAMEPKRFLDVKPGTGGTAGRGGFSIVV